MIANGEKKKVEDKCPRCGRHLIIRKGQYGEFLGCPRYPTCKFSKHLPVRDLKIYQPPSPYCEKCNHTGKIPFEKNGKVVAHCWVYCQCHQDEQGHPHQLTPDQFDYPMSFDHYRALCQLHGWRDPGSDKPLEPIVPQVIEHIHRYSNLGKVEYDLLQQTALKADFIYKKLTEHTEYKKKRTSKFT